MLFQAEEHCQHQGGTDPAGSHHGGAETCLFWRLEFGPAWAKEKEFPCHLRGG